MNKIILRGVSLIALFFALWFALAQIDWVSIFHVEKVTDTTEKKLGELFWEIFQKSDDINDNPVINNTIDSLVTKICEANQLDQTQIKLHVLNKDDINAFALPDGHLVVYTGLLANADNAEEVAAVLGHEIAHIQLKHVMKKLVREVGLSMLISMTTGNGGTEMIKETAKMLSSSAFDRGLEKEADIKAVDYLIEANINPEPFADFLYKLADTEGEAMKYLTWMRTHPDSKERAEYIIEYARDKKTSYKPAITENTWIQLKAALAN